MRDLSAGERPEGGTVTLKRTGVPTMAMEPEQVLRRRHQFQGGRGARRSAEAQGSNAPLASPWTRLAILAAVVVAALAVAW